MKISQNVPVLSTKQAILHFENVLLEFKYFYFKFETSLECLNHPISCLKLDVSQKFMRKTFRNRMFVFLFYFMLLPLYLYF